MREDGASVTSSDEESKGPEGKPMSMEFALREIALEIAKDSAWMDTNIYRSDLAGITKDM